MNIKKNIIYIFVIIIILFSYFNLFFIQLQNNDEIICAALAKRFLLGDKPFIDEIITIQTHQIIMLPFYKLYHLVTLNYDGILLFSRHLFFLLMLSIVLMTYISFGRETQILVPSLVFLVFTPLSMPNITYYSVGTTFFIISRILSLEKNRLKIFFCGISDSISTIAFFPFGIPSIATSLFEIIKQKRLQNIILYFIGVLCVIFPFFLYIGLTPKEIILSSFKILINSRYPHKSLLDTQRLFYILKEITPLLVKPFYLLIIILVTIRINDKVRYIIYCFFPIILWWINRCSRGGLGATSFMLSIMFLAPFVLKNESPKNKILLFKFWLPSLICSFLGAFFSTKTTHTFAAGCLLGVFVTIYGISLKGIKYLVPSFFIIFALMQFEFRYFNAKNYIMINEGPLKWLHAPNEETLYLKELSKRLKKIPHSKSLRLLTIPTERLSHLLSDLKPVSNNIWSFCEHFPTRKCIDFYLKKFNEVGGVVIFKNKIDLNKIKRLYKKIREECKLDSQNQEIEVYICNEGVNY